ncbi:MAG: tRNA preQ1(34) S-adenosylmethionine ribosyltransferase-isomerase QueA [Myxococcaceae bacterium]
MELADFNFELPPSLIAQEPLPQRDASRLLVLRGDDAEHRGVRDLPELLAPGDLLIVNDSRVVPARLVGQKRGTGGKTELLLVRPDVGNFQEALAHAPDTHVWECLGQASKGLKPGTRVDFEGGLEAEILTRAEDGGLRVRFRSTTQSFAEALAVAGRIPLPPYIGRAPTLADTERYQTVFAQLPGSVAAPTAGLHFTPALLAAFERRSIERAHVTLEVGPGTFAPVRDLAHHPMHAERFVVPDELPGRIAQVRSRGGRVIAVGTTVVRVLESATTEEEALRAGAGETALFIRPGFKFRQVDGLMTNFHLPQSTLLMLVSAFGGHARVMRAYAAAVREAYRFYSYGDAMLIFPEGKT